MYFIHETTGWWWQRRNGGRKAGKCLSFPLCNIYIYIYIIIIIIIIIISFFFMTCVAPTQSCIRLSKEGKTSKTGMRGNLRRCQSRTTTSMREGKKKKKKMQINNVTIHENMERERKTENRLRSTARLMTSYRFLFLCLNFSQ